MKMDEVSHVQDSLNQVLQLGFEVLLVVDDATRGFPQML